MIWLHLLQMKDAVWVGTSIIRNHFAVVNRSELPWNMPMAINGDVIVNCKRLWSAGHGKLI